MLTGPCGFGHFSSARDSQNSFLSISKVAGLELYLEEGYVIVKNEESFSLQSNSVRP